jgi:hydrogenase maturation protease
LNHQNTLILGIGNTLLADEGVGVQMLDYLRGNTTWAERYSLVDGGTLSFTLAPLLEQAGRLVVIDAAQLDAPPGTVRVFEGADMDEYSSRPGRSVHEVSLGDLLAITQLTETIPPLRALVAIQPETVAWGHTLSEPVQQALPRAAQVIERLLEGWDATVAPESLFARFRNRTLFFTE